MSLVAAAVVLAAAAIHAIWNALVKHSGDPLLAQWGILAAGSAACLPFLPVVGWPPEACLPWLVAAVAVHTLYHLVLAHSYTLGDLSQVYPLARGSAPLVVAVGATFAAGETLAWHQALALLTVCGGIASLARGGPEAARVVPLALAVGATIGAYSVVDGVGVRRAGSPWVFLVWLQVTQFVPLTAVVWWRRRFALRGFARRFGVRVGLGGLAAMLAYGAVLWAYAHAPLAHVSALRETSVVFAALIGATLLGEDSGRRRVLAAAIVAAGVVALHVGG
ncbi:MAG: DMT family transporter [Proteobacteria bacterium]|nr:DMT family transporter [Pseudomonadota bacterium]